MLARKTDEIELGQVDGAAVNLGDATYSPDDNKLRMTPFARLDRETYQRMRDAGFVWAPKQEIFVAPMWTPARVDLLVELCGEIADEDTTLNERAEERAERFEGYQEARMNDYHNAHDSVKRIAEHIPFGQPILIGHHSERRARKDAERIENDMRRAVKAFETAGYWQQRAAGALAHAKHKERPDVRARRIKKLESDLRQKQRSVADVRARLAAWTAVTSHAQAWSLACNSSGSETVAKREGSAFGWSAYDVLQPEDKRYAACPAMAWEDVRRIRLESCERYLRDDGYAARWIEHYENRLAYERAMLAETGYIEPPKRATKAVLPLLNYPGIVRVRNPYQNRIDEFEAVPMTRAEFSEIHADYKGTRISEDGTHRVRSAMVGAATGRRGLAVVFLIDSKQHTKPGAGPVETREQQETQARIEKAQAENERRTKARKQVLAHNRAVIDGTATAGAAPSPALPADVEAMRDTLRAGVQIVTAPQLFPTPRAVAERMAELAQIEPSQSVLEPSAGTGALIAALPAGVRVHAIEKQHALAIRLAQLYPAAVVSSADFLCCDPSTLVSRINGDPIHPGQFDAVVLNPPFENATDIAHILRALEFVRPGGRLVALCANGPRQNERLRPIAEQWEDLPAGTFEGTNVRAALLVITKPAQ